MSIFQMIIKSIKNQVHKSQKLNQYLKNLLLNLNRNNLKYYQINKKISLFNNNKILT
jgi:hypothetical protein